MRLLFFLIFILNALITNIKCQAALTPKTVSICADEYRLNSYPLQCQFGQAVNIIQVVEKFEKNNQRPDCYGKGSLDYNYSKPIVDFCNGKTECVLSSAFIDEKKLFDAETYFLPDNSYYLIPYRIDIIFDCSSNIVLTTTQPIFTQETTETTTTSTETTTSTSTTTTTTTSTTTTTATTSSTTTLTPNTTEFFSVSNVTVEANNSTENISNPTTTTSTTTKVASYEPNSDTDRTVMIVLIVLGSVFFLIIIAIAILICIRRQNQAKLDREFGYKNDYSGDDSVSNEGNISTIGGSIKQKHISGPFSEMSGFHSSRNMESLTGTFGTYRSKSNEGYDNSDRSVDLSNDSSRMDNRRPRVDSNEYWRTNV